MYDSNKAAEYAKFCLKYNMLYKGQYYFNLVEEFDKSENMQIIKGALFMWRKEFKRAEVVFNKILDSDWKNTLANLMIGILYDKL